MFEISHYEITGVKINLHTTYLSTCMKPRGWVTIKDYYIRLLHSWSFHNHDRNRYYNGLILQEFVKLRQMLSFLSIFTVFHTSKGPKFSFLSTPYRPLLWVPNSPWPQRRTQQRPRPVGKGRNEKVASSDL